MKKTIIFLITILLLQTLPIGFSAEEAQYETVFDLLQLWGQNGYPDYVCGIWSNDGSIYNLSVGIVEGEESEKGKAEILDLIKDDDSVTFVTMKYNRNYLCSIQEYIDSFFKSDIGLITTGLYEEENIIKIEIHKDYSDNEQTAEFIEHIKETFGDAVQVEFTDLIIKATAGIDTITPTFPTPEKKQSFETYLYISAAILTVLTATMFFFFGRKKARLMQTAEGQTLVQTKFSEKKIIEEVKTSKVSPSKTLDKKILDEIEKI